MLEEDEERSREYHLACEQWEQRAAAAARVGEAPPKRPQLVPNMMLLNMQPGPYLLHALSSVRAAELEQVPPSRACAFTSTRCRGGGMLWVMGDEIVIHEWSELEMWRSTAFARPRQTTLHLRGCWFSRRG